MSKDVSLVSMRYARSLFTMTKKSEAVGDQEAAYKRSFAAFDQIFSVRDAVDVLKSPVMPKDLKWDLLLLGLNDPELDDIFKNFIGNLLETDRVMLIPEIGKAYESILMEMRNIKRAKIVSARKLPDDLLQKMERVLSKLFSKKILLSPEVDQSLLGGFVVEVDNYLLDYSLKSAVNFSMKLGI